jgi:arylsulfatase A-like enzyme
MKFRKLIFLSTLFISSLSAETAPNILFIAIDDMNDWTGFLGGHPQAQTPNMDTLAKAGVNFTNAHCSAPGCSPSRNALLYGIEPFNSGLYPFYEHEIHQDLHQKYTSLPRLLKENSYNTYGSGKIHHGPKGDSREWTDYYEPKNFKMSYAQGEGYQVGKSHKSSFRPTISPYEEHLDHQFVDYGIDILSQKHDKPFFLAVGIVKPHLPFNSPKAFFDALPAVISPPEIPNDDLKDIPKEAKSFLKTRDDKQFKKDKAWEDVRRAYLACISWADYNVGRLVKALEESEYADNTIIVLWSDHGYHMGEKNTFRKFTLWEESTRVPFIIKDLRPESNSQKGNCHQAVSLINIYKTIADFADIKVPNYVDGVSLSPLLQDLSKKINYPAITSWGKGNYSIRSDDWRYTRYHDETEELYFHKTDPNEWHNLAQNPEYENKKNELKKLLPKSSQDTVQKHIATWSLRGADKISKKSK